jgi:hypothetical protein
LKPYKVQSELEIGICFAVIFVVAGVAVAVVADDVDVVNVVWNFIE